MVEIRATRNSSLLRKVLIGLALVAATAPQARAVVALPAQPSQPRAQVDVASVPVLKRVLSEKQKELFGDKPKRHAFVCVSESSRDYFFGFWKPYFTHGDESMVKSFRSLEEAYDWLGLSD